jgi:hypothetical protein
MANNCCKNDFGKLKRIIIVGNYFHLMSDKIRKYYIKKDLIKQGFDKTEADKIIFEFYGK